MDQVRRIGGEMATAMAASFERGMQAVSSSIPTRADVRAVFASLRTQIDESAPVNIARGGSVTVREEIDATKAHVQAKAGELRQITQAAAAKVNAAYQALITPTLGKVAGAYGAAALTVTVGLLATAVVSSTSLISIPALCGAFVAIGVTFSIYNLYMTAKTKTLPETQQLEFFQNNVRPTIERTARFYSALTLTGLVVLGGAAIHHAL